MSYATLKKIPGHRNFYVNLKSGVIYFKRGKIKFSTGVKKISEAIRVADAKLALLLGPGASRAKLRKQRGIIHPLLRDEWKVFLENKRPEVTKTTMMTYNQNWKYGIEPFWGDKTTKEVTEQNLLIWKNWYLSNRPTRIVNHTIIHLWGLFKYLKRQKLIWEVPDMEIVKSMPETIARNAKRPKVGRVYSEKEIQKLIDVCNSEEFGKNATRTRRGILLGARHGMRKSEALHLKWDNINLEQGFMKVWSQKNHKWRDVPLTDLMRDELKKRDTVSPFVFPMRLEPNRPISSQLFDKDWKRAKRLAGIRGKARFHDLRHTFATRTAEFGWPPVVACEVLDMSLKIYQQVYCKPSRDAKSEWMAKTFNQKKGN